MLESKTKFTQLFLILSTFISFAKQGKAEVKFNAGNYFFALIGLFSGSPSIRVQTQEEMAKLSTISQDGMGFLAYLDLRALKGLENRKIKISKGSLHLFRVFLDAAECQKKRGNCLFEKPPLVLYTNDEDIERILPPFTVSSFSLGEVKFSGPANKSYLKQMHLNSANFNDVDLSKNSQMVLLRGLRMRLILENVENEVEKNGNCSFFLNKDPNTKLRLINTEDGSTMLEMSLNNIVAGGVLEKAISYTPPKEFDEEYDFNEVMKSQKVFDQLGVRGKVYWDNTGDKKPAADQDGGDNGSGDKGKNENGDGKGADGKPQEKSLFSQPVFWVIVVLSVGLVVILFYIYINAKKKKYVVSHNSSLQAQEVKN